MFLQPVSDPFRYDLLPQRGMPFHLLGIKRKDLIKFTKGKFTDKRPFQNQFQLFIGHLLNELVEEQPFLFIIKRWYLKEMIIIVFQFLPESIIFVIDRN